MSQLKDDVDVGSQPGISGHGAKFDRKRESVIAALLTEDTVTEAARVCGLAPATVYRWLKDRGFADDYSAARAELLRAATNRLRTLAVDAVGSLEDVMRDVKAPSQARVTASRTVLEFALRTHDSEELAERLRSLEEAMEGER